MTVVCPHCEQPITVVRAPVAKTKPKKEPEPNGPIENERLMGLLSREDRIVEAMKGRVGWLATSDIVVAARYPAFPLREVLLRLKAKGLVKHSRTGKGKDIWMLLHSKLPAEEVSG